jgi:predicted nucleotidyltransferase
MDKIEVIEKLKDYIILLEKHFDLDQVILFGSYASGNFNENSDIDVAVIVKKINGDYFSTVPLLWKLRRQIDDRIEPVLFEKGRDDSGFLTGIIKYGIVIK